MNYFPVLASTLFAKDLGKYMQEHYHFASDVTCELFRTGMNHTYFLYDGATKYAVRVYSHSWRTKVEIEEELALLIQLSDNNIAVSYPIADKNNHYIQQVNAPEGIRYVVLFSFATGEKVRFLDAKTCYTIGTVMAKFHSFTANKTIERITYTKKTLLETPYLLLKKYFSEDTSEMKYLKNSIATIENSDFEEISKGIVHLDIWYDNMAVQNENEITIFDFDFCGNGWFILDIGYFCNQLFNIESDKEPYENKKNSFLEGYQSIKRITDKEIGLIPKAGLAVFTFYLGVQAHRFDWSNIFLTQNYLKMYVGRIQSWMDYHN